MIDIDFVKDELKDYNQVYVVSDKEKKKYQYSLMKVNREGTMWVKIVIKNRSGDEISKIKKLEELDAIEGRIVSKTEYDDFGEEKVDIVSYIGDELRAGRRVYVLEKYRGYVMCYDPNRPLKVLVKLRGGKIKYIDPRNIYLYEDTVDGYLITESEFEVFR